MGGLKNEVSICQDIDVMVHCMWEQNIRASVCIGFCFKDLFTYFR